MQVARRSKAEFRPDSTAPATGVYLVVHHEDHRPPHLVTVLRDDTFPRCRVCKNYVVFILHEPSIYVTDDWDLAGPARFDEAPARRRRTAGGVR